MAGHHVLIRENQSGPSSDAVLVIRVGSLNPVKLGAIREVMRVPFPLARFEPVPAPSEVPDQPLGLEETLRGAKNRARNAFADCALSVALESGLIEVPGSNTGYMNLTACAIYDGREMYLGLGPAFELPPDVTRLVVEDGLELDPAVRQAGLTDNERIGYAQGIIGILSGGRVTRMDYSRPAVSMALVRMGR
ncbi:inosine/xanthosine triphosphatase [Desulfomicrobium sp. ZS1]|uniref:inosine/xanthosine triphosphatase n=1 Tax=Desulfomicrobium sp. ZS1 TaxID=2952228 RepID=UPI0020B26C20|nr:inosine/xanthosine triphosphatase [Desulfomicrobium sp. ZS1]UTF48946.1 inosine/xanthosine triphosphatase [Desulfomicrobium sp. ZS1]